MIKIILNGEQKAVAMNRALAAILIESGFNCSRVAVAVNSEFVARSHYEDFFLKPDDVIDVVVPVAGG